MSVIQVPQLHTHFPAVENIVTKINLQFLPALLSASGPFGGVVAMAHPLGTQKWRLIS